MAALTARLEVGDRAFGESPHERVVGGIGFEGREQGDVGLGGAAQGFGEAGSQGAHLADVLGELGGAAV